MLMEILKQPQYSPIPVEKQVMILYAAINHHLSDIELEDIKKFEREFYEFMDEQYREVGESIKAEGQISEDVEEKLKEAIDVFKKEFLKNAV